MATTTDLEKEAAKSLKLPLLGFASSDLGKGYLALAASLGLIGGAGLGAFSSYVNAKNPELTALDRQKKFYDKKISDMENENWLNDVLTLKKKLETNRLSDDERKDIEKQYLKLINK